MKTEEVNEILDEIAETHNLDIRYGSCPAEYARYKGHRIWEEKIDDLNQIWDVVLTAFKKYEKEGYTCIVIPDNESLEKNLSEGKIIFYLVKPH